MKTYTAPLSQNRNWHSAAWKKRLSLMTASMCKFVILSVALLAAAVIVTLSVWLAGFGNSGLLDAGTWGLGFLFLGLAVDNNGPLAGRQTVTGAALLILALLQDRVSADFFIVSAVLLAVWTGFVLFGRLSRQDV